MKKKFFLLILLAFFACKKNELEPKPKACFSFSPDNGLKTGDTLKFSNCSENATSYFWDFGDSTSSLEKIPTHIFEKSGNFKIILSAKYKNYVDTISKYAFINVLKPKACFLYSPVTGLRTGDTLKFTNCSENATSFLWDFGDGKTSTDKTPNHFFMYSGNYNVKLTSANDNSTDSITKVVVINPKPDNILYHKLEPQVSLYSVRYYYLPVTLNPYCNYVIPFPEDSSTSYSFDVNGDSINDFKITASHSAITNDNCGHCNYHFEYNISISSLSTNDSIGYKTDETTFGFGYSLFNNLVYTSGITLSVSYPCNGGVSLGFSDSYIAFKLKNNYGWIHIYSADNNGIVISEFAINLTDYNPIKAGQME